MLLLLIVSEDLNVDILICCFLSVRYIQLKKHELHEM